MHKGSRNKQEVTLRY